MDKSTSHVYFKSDKSQSVKAFSQNNINILQTKGIKTNKSNLEYVPTKKNPFKPNELMERKNFTILSPQLGKKQQYLKIRLPKFIFNELSEEPFLNQEYKKGNPKHERLEKHCEIEYYLNYHNKRK